MINIDMALYSFRFAAGLMILLWASYSDFKTRTAPNLLWLILGATGIILLLIEYITIGFEILSLIVIPLIFALAYLLFRVGIIFGGADAKALMALSILIPFWPHINGFPLWESLMPFPWVIFSNAIILFLFIPPILLVFNTIKQNIDFPYSLLGYKVNIKEAKKKQVWPLEKISKGKRKLVFTPIDEDITNQLQNLKDAGKTEIWVTPKIPFMIPLLIGFILSFILGDILFTIIRLFL